VLAGNRILAALPPAAYARLLPDLELVCIPAGEGIYETDIRITHLYFPIDCIVACIGELESGAAFQTSITGVVSKEYQYLGQIYAPSNMTSHLA
jgi:hypothetical protein